MIDLFKAQLIRFRWWLAAFGFAHLGVLAFVSRMMDPLQQRSGLYNLIGVLYFVLGLLFGLYQLGGYRRPNAWLNLMHRPLPRRAIGAGVFGAGAFLLALAVALPVLAIVAGQYAWTARVVDTRHWWLPVAAWCVAMAGYLFGAYCMIAARRYAVLVLSLPLLPLYSDAAGGAMMAIHAAVLIWLTVLVAIAFKPDLSAPPRGLAANLAVALPVQAMIYVLLCVAINLGFQLGWIAIGSDPLNSGAPPKGGLIESDRAKGPDLIIAGLAASADADARLWREQARISEVYRIGPRRQPLPTRGELVTAEPQIIGDASRNLLWSYSDDSGYFHGRDTLTRRAAGTLGVSIVGDDAQRPLPSPPLPVGDGYVLTEHAVYQYDPHDARLRLRMALPGNEIPVAAPEPAGDSTLLLSDRALYFFDLRGFAENVDAPAPLPRQRIDLAGPVGNLSGVDVLEIGDGYLVSMTYGSRNFQTLGDGYQVVFKLGEDGRVAQVARRELSPDFPALLRYRLYWLSPAMQALEHAAVGFLARPQPLYAVEPPPVPDNIRMHALVLCVLSFFLAWNWSARMRLSRVERWAWIIGCGLVGIPALLSLRLIHPLSPRREPAMQAVPIAAPA